MLLPSLNSCVNPWIYLLLNRNLLYTLLKLLFGNKCIQTEPKYPNETTNQRLSISMHKTTYQPADGLASSVNNSPTTNNSLITPVHLVNAGSSPTSVDTILRKNRLKRIMSDQSMKSDQQYKLDAMDTRISDKFDTSSDKQRSDKNVRNQNQNGQHSKSDRNATKLRTVDTVASLNLLNKISVEKCTGMQIKNFNLPRVSSETLTTHKQQFVYQSSSSAPDLKIVNK